MKEILKKMAREVLGFAGAHPTALTDKRALTALIGRLHPKCLGIELIRLGPSHDGGYLVPNDLLEIEACFSPGVGKISGFEKDCVKLGMKVFMADKSVDRPAISDNKLNFIKKHIGATRSDEFMTIDDWVDSSLPGSKSDLLLQIDIEGYEYETFLSMSNNLIQRFRIIVAEFHGLHGLWSRPFFSLASRAFEKILQTHTCVHIHPNNSCGLLRINNLDIPRVMEFTFLRNDRVKNSSFASAFPHPLDSDNGSECPLPLPNCWYKQEESDKEQF